MDKSTDGKIKLTIELGEKLGFYKDKPVTKGCTPASLPEIIRLEAAKFNT